ncbi:Crp/Fnr family transcriptional regulator [Dyella jiangningensis]|jgi:CRP/FNR family transcriptional regulator|uniref:Crp/Fnr family transcriptional regulator n=1 Tax=Dyella jiangningensis TaxID=1379159 RepID=UPI0004563847|nr:helix-turn-helix domain-containing protein [Dyella jiangningensis]AHX13317.1 Crp/Fnr family transcriptional regulator [Dyella jiangningensis]MDG2538748.1 helix-turn-helix domain-containing protein [Dyella jiangningensis]
MNMRLMESAVAELPAGRSCQGSEDVPFELDVDTLRRYVTVLRHKLVAGQPLYHAGQPFKSLFLVHAGFIKTIELSDDGRDQVTGFRGKGEFLGTESIGLSHYACGAVSLESGEAWELPYPAMLSACREIPELHARLAAALASEIRNDRTWMLNIGTLNAEQRVAAFLLSEGRRYARMGFSARHFMLRMRRADMASFLALTNETVCRVMTKLHEMHLIEVARREVRVLDDGALRTLVGASRLTRGELKASASC